MQLQTWSSCMKCGCCLRSRAGARRAPTLQPERTANRFTCPRTTLRTWYGNLSCIHICKHHYHTAVWHNLGLSWCPVHKRNEITKRWLSRTAHTLRALLYFVCSAVSLYFLLLGPQFTVSGQKLFFKTFKNAFWPLQSVPVHCVPLAVFEHETRPVCTPHVKFIW